MNNILELKGEFKHIKRKNLSFEISMNSKIEVSCNYLERLKSQLIQIKNFWDNTKRPFDGILISVCYNKIVAKSNRILGLFKGKKSNNAIVGAKFNDEKNKHIITYFINYEDLIKSIELLSTVKKILSDNFQGKINKLILDNKDCILKNIKDYKEISVSLFKQVIADASYIDHFQIETPSNKDLIKNIVTIYDVKKDTVKLFQELGIDILKTRILENNTVYLNNKQLEILLEKAPYLISMSTTDISTLSPNDINDNHEKETIKIPNPTIEPTIGVIDTLFEETVYFSNWVEYHNMLPKDILTNKEDCLHGTSVSSIIVDGPRLNPWLDDGCGRFKVRHFGVMGGSSFSAFSIIKKIKEIVANNLDIKVWNISLGSNEEINDNFISAGAYALDKIQFENDVIFVIAGTNKRKKESSKKIGSPADSINSIVVNSVSKDGLSTNYSRKGLVLSFFAKPDVSYYGGDEKQYINVCTHLGKDIVQGTSYACPWIARKLSYLIDILGFNREIAKALIIDSARGWNEFSSPENIALYGHGIVPIHINEIIKTKDNEIKFFVSDITEKWNNYNYNFPIPLDKQGRYPFIAKATMCYIPSCNRSQGVDYTNTELNLHFGRMKDDKKIIDIKGDKQNNDDFENDHINYLLEDDARKQFRKWDNVKYIVEKSSKRKIGKKSFNNKNWGMEIKTNSRLNPEDSKGIRFGVVITLKEINNKNRIEEFIQNCHFNKWLVNEINVENKITIHQKVNEDINFE